MTEHRTALEWIASLDTLDMDKSKALRLVKAVARAALCSEAEVLDSLSDDERLEVFAEYCTSCGAKDPTCQCWNDE